MGHERAAWGDTNWVSPVTDEQRKEGRAIVRPGDLDRVSKGEDPLQVVKTPEEIEMERIRKVLGK